MGFNLKPFKPVKSTEKCYPCEYGNHSNCDIFVEETGCECACMHPDCVYLRTVTNVN